MKKGSLFVIFIIFFFFSTATASQDPISILSPNGTIRAEVSVSPSGRLFYTVSLRGIQALLPSPLGIIINHIDLGQDVSFKTPELSSHEETYALRGAHNTALNFYRDALIPITHKASQTEYSLRLRVFDDGVALQYLVPGKKKRKIIGEKTSWSFPPGCQIWWQDDIEFYEGQYRGSPLPRLPLGTRMGPPSTVELPDGAGYALISEADLVGYSGMSLVLSDINTLQAQFPWDRKGWLYSGTLTTPWRVTILTSDLESLVNSDICTNLCPPPPSNLEMAEWISPGKAVWHWWSSGGPPLGQQHNWIDRTAQLGFKYYLIDDGWRNWEAVGNDKWACLKDVIAYGKEKNVKILVWVQYKELRNRQKRLDFLQKIKGTGAAGLKIDFIPGESKKTINWYEDTLKDLAEFQLLANFHGCNKPTGRQRSWPHELTREGIRGHEYQMERLNRSLSPAHNAILPFTRFVVGYADYTPTAFNPEELRGFTWAHELAQAVVFLSPITHFADNPEFYIANPAEAILKTVPTVWDETKVLPPSKIGQTAVFARRTGQNWFIGVLNGVEAHNITLDLSFLGEGSFSSFEFYDNATNPAAFVTKEENVTSDKTLNIPLNSAGGFVAMLIRRPPRS